MQEMFEGIIYANPLFLIAQVVGFIGMILLLVSFQYNNKKRIIIFFSLASAMWGFHFLMLGAFTGASINFIEAIRGLVFMRGEKLKRPMFWCVFFSAIFAISGYLTWADIHTLTTTLSVILVTFALCYGSTRVIRICSTFASIVWLIHNGVQLSIAGVITEAFILVSLSIAFWRFDIRKQQKFDEEESK